LDVSRELLLDRLRGLTDIPSQSFEEHELVFSIKGGISNPIVIHVRRTLQDPNKEQPAPWLIRYVSQPESDLTRKWPTVVRKSVDVLVQSDDMMQFLKDLGFRLDYEYVAKGDMFVKGRVKILVSKISGINERGNPQRGQTTPLTDSHLVEVSVIAPFGQDALAQECRSIADQLKPIVNLEKLDYTTQLMKQPKAS